MNKMSDRFINGTLTYCVNHPWVITVGTLMIAFSALLQISKISFDTDIKSLVILVALAVADEIHIFGSYSHFLRHSSADTKRAAIAAVMQLWRPVILTSVTTACAFLSFLSNPTKPLQYFGAMTAFGVMVVYQENS